MVESYERGTKLNRSSKCILLQLPPKKRSRKRAAGNRLETASRLEMRRRSGGRIFATAAVRSAQFRSDFVQQLQPIGTIWSLAQCAPAFLRFIPRRAVLPRADARAAHTFFQF